MTDRLTSEQEVDALFDELVTPIGTAAGLIGDWEEADLDISKILGRARGALCDKSSYADAAVRWRIARGVERLGDYLAKRPEVSDPTVLSELLLGTQRLADAIRRLIPPDEMGSIYQYERTSPRGAQT